MDVCVQFAMDIAGKGKEELAAIISNSNIRTVARCITDTLRCDEERRFELDTLARSASDLTVPLLSLLKQRDTYREFHDYPGIEGSLGGDLNTDVENEIDRNLLQVCLRLIHAGFLTSEVHQTVWDRHVDGSNVGRIRSLRFNLLESILCDSFSEMTLLDSPKDLSLFRTLFEWDQTLRSLKKNIERQT